jgi:hypothetical protein
MIIFPIFTRKTFFNYLLVKRLLGKTNFNIQKLKRNGSYFF